MNGNGGLQREYPRKGREVIGAGNAAEEVGSIDERPRCRYCGRLFSSVQHLRQHVEFTHEKWRQGPHAEEGSTATPRNPASASYGVQSPAARWDEEFLTSLSEMRMVHHVPRDAVTTIKEQVQRQVATIREQVLSRVSPHMGPGTDPESLLGDIFTLCRDFTQRDSELDRLRQSPAYVQPKRRWLGTHAESGEVFYAYDNPLDQALSAMWKTQPHTFQDVENFSERVRNGEFRTDGSYDPGLVIGDTLDGSGMGSFMKKFRLVNVGGLIVVFIFYYDGLEVVNGLGQARLTHELGCFYFAQVPLNQIYRLNSVHLRLATVCLKRAITAVGMHTVIHGLPEQQDDPGCHAWGLWMKRLKRGHSLDTPVGQRIVRGGTALLAADTPAAAECQGYKKSVGHSTKSICRSCHCEQCQGMDDSPHRSPNSFLAGLPGWKDHCKGRKQKFTLRSDKDLLEFLKKGREVMDIMHIVFEGIARMQLGALAYAGINKWGWKPNDVPRRLAEFARESGCGRHELPYINTSRVLHLGQGQEGGVPSSDCSFPGTAMQVAKVILSVDAIFGPLCTEHKRDPVWQVP